MENTFYWFSVTAQYDQVDDNGKRKTIKEKFLVKAISPTDAENTVTAEYEGTSIEFRIIGMAEQKFMKVLLPESIGLND
jgi:hypothetical protein